MMVSCATGFILILCLVAVTCIYINSRYTDRLGLQYFHARRTRTQVEGLFEEASGFLRHSSIEPTGSTADIGYRKISVGDGSASRALHKGLKKRGEQGGYYMGMDEEEEDGEGHSAEEYGKNGRDITSPFSSAKYEKTHWFDDITILIKTFNRPKPTKDLISSIREYFPTIQVFVADDGILNQRSKYRIFGPPGVKYFKLQYDQGLSYGRNYLVRKASTKFVLVLDDDFQFIKNTSLSKLYSTIQTLNADIVAGKLDDRAAFGANIQAVQKTKRVVVTPASRPTDHNASQCWKTQRVLNFFLARRIFLLNNPWEDGLKLEEHTFFFASAFMRNNFGKNVSIFSCDDVLVHHNVQPRKRSYDVLRKRAMKYGTKAKMLYMKKYGYRLDYCVGDCGVNYGAVRTLQ